MKMKKVIATVVLMGTAFAANANILIDGSFDSALNAGFESGMAHNGANDQTGIGWVGPLLGVNDCTYNTTAGTLEWGPAASVYGTSLSSWTKGIGQINTDNQETTGNVSFDFVVDAVNLGGTETISMAIELFYFTGGSATFNNKLSLIGDTDGSNWTSLGAVQTASITAAGTYSTGTIDLGSGYDVVGLRLIPIDNGTAGWNDKVTLSSVSVIPEPATLGLITAFGGGIVFVRRLLIL
jgi:hypothetical protein